MQPMFAAERLSPDQPLLCTSCCFPSNHYILSNHCSLTNHNLLTSHCLLTDDHPLFAVQPSRARVCAHLWEASGQHLHAICCSSLFAPNLAATGCRAKERLLKLAWTCSASHSCRSVQQAFLFKNCTLSFSKGCVFSYHCHPLPLCLH